MFLEVKNLSKTYITKTFLSEKRFKALDNISFTLDKNEFLSVIGSSGSGKSTLGRILANILNFDEGSIKYFDKDINEYRIQEFSKIVQLIFQNPYSSLNPKLKIKSSFLEVFNNKKDTDVKNKIKESLEKVGLDEKILKNYPHQFSGGQRQRIAIARALLKNPKLIIADEPFASLDVYSQNQILNIFKNIKENSDTSIILITHDINAAAKFSQKMVIMENGKLIKNDTTENIFKEKENKYIVDLLSSMEL